MKIIKLYNDCASIENQNINKCLNGKWSDWERCFAIKSENEVAIVSLNIFERILKAFHITCFSRVFGRKKVEVINSNNLQELHKKVQDAGQAINKNGDIQNNEAIKEKVELIKEVMEQNVNNIDAKFKQTEALLKLVAKPEEVPQAQPEKRVEQLNVNLEKKPNALLIDASQMKRILLAQKFNRPEEDVDIKKFEKLIPAFQAFKAESQKADSALQNEYGNRDRENIIFLSINDFGKQNDLTLFELERFIRYLVMTDQIHGYGYARVGFRLELNDHPNEIGVGVLDNTFFTKEFLLKIDFELQKLNLKTKDAFPNDEQEFVDKVLERIESIRYQRIARGLSKEIVDILSVKIYNSSSKQGQCLDHLVKEGLIHSWNAHSRLNDLSVKLYQDDLVKNNGDFIFKEWRDLNIIQKEEEFKDKNRIVLKDKDNAELQAKFNENEKLQLNELIEGINKRVHHGSFRKEKCDSVLKELNTRGYIYEFKRIGFTQTFEVFVKEADKEIV